MVGHVGYCWVFRILRAGTILVFPNTRRAEPILKNFTPTQLLLTLGLQLETASRGSMALYTQIVFALAFERIVFGVSPSGLSVVGICVIMLSAIYVAVSLGVIW